MVSVLIVVQMDADVRHHVSTLEAAAGKGSCLGEEVESEAGSMATRSYIAIKSFFMDLLDQSG